MLEKMKEIIAEQLGVDASDVFQRPLRMTLVLILLTFLSSLWHLRRSSTVRFLQMI